MSITQSPAQHFKSENAGTMKYDVNLEHNPIYTEDNLQISLYSASISSVQHRPLFSVLPKLVFLFLPRF